MLSYIEVNVNQQAGPEGGSSDPLDLHLRYVCIQNCNGISMYSRALQLQRHVGEVLQCFRDPMAAFEASMHCATLCSKFSL